MIQKAMVLGMARSGIAAAKLLLLRGAEVWVCDQKKKEDFAGALDEIEKSLVDGDEAAAGALCTQAGAALTERNRICRLNK